MGGVQSTTLIILEPRTLGTAPYQSAETSRHGRRSRGLEGRHGVGDKLAMTAEDISGTSLNELGDSDEIYFYLSIYQMKSHL